MVSTIPVLILGNKIDILGVCRGKEQLIQDLGIHIHLSEYVSSFLNLYLREGGMVRRCHRLTISLTPLIWVLSLIYTSPVLSFLDTY